jgi:16S rRNA (uracil1498-N3)-methyltransferase
LSGDLFNHLTHSLRHRVNDRLKLVDEKQRSYSARITRIEPSGLEAEVRESAELPEPLSPRLILAQALIKKNRMDLVIEKATELGVSEIVPLITERTVVHPSDERLDRQIGRWEKIILEAAQQSERPSLPKILPPVEFGAFLRTASPKPGLFFREGETRTLKSSLASLLPAAAGSAFLMLIGPEGGWSQNEIALSAEKGYISVSLGPRTLRSETAVITAVTLCQYELGYFGI